MYAKKKQDKGGGGLTRYFLNSLVKIMVKVKLMCCFNSFNLIRENSEVVRLGRFNFKVHKLKFYSEWLECIDFE